MKNSTLYILVAPFSENSYWWINIKRGVNIEGKLSLDKFEYRILFLK